MDNQQGGGRRDFPGLLRQTRGKKGMSRAQLAHAAGVSNETIRRWEAGDYEPRTAQVARQLDEVLGTQFELMLFGTGPSEPDTLHGAAIDSGPLARRVEELEAQLRSLESAVSDVAALVREQPRGRSGPSNARR